MAESWLHDDAEVKAALRDKYQAEAAKARADLAVQQVSLETQQLYLARSSDDDAFRRAANIEHQVYRFSGHVDEASTGLCIEHLTRWSRLNPFSDMTITMNSPGGYVTAGMDLFDTLLELRSYGHKVTMIGRGYVASMASILLQAADVRVMGPGCAMLIHEPSGMALGSLGEIEDAAEWLNMTASRILDIYAERCASSAAEKPYTRTQLKNGWNRKNWWLTSESCLKGGLIDEIR